LCRYAEDWDDDDDDVPALGDDDDDDRVDLLEDTDDADAPVVASRPPAAGAN
jgi:hypothetical protein